MTRFERVNHAAYRWWPFLASFAALAVLATMAIVTLSVVEDNDRKAKELAAIERRAEIAEERNEQLADIIEAERESQETRDERLGDAVSQVSQVLNEAIASHDAQVNRLFQRQLAQIAELLGRPQGTPPDPVAAKPAPSGTRSPSPASSPAPRPTATTIPKSSPTTAAPEPTTPQQKSCERRPDGPHC